MNDPYSTEEYLMSLSFLNQELTYLNNNFILPTNNEEVHTLLNALQNLSDAYFTQNELIKNYGGARASFLKQLHKRNKVLLQKCNARCNTFFQIYKPKMVMINRKMSEQLFTLPSKELYLLKNLLKMFIAREKISQKSK